jgi:uncharacterized protein (DUF305 family)
MLKQTTMILSAATMIAMAMATAAFGSHTAATKLPEICTGNAQHGGHASVGGMAMEAGDAAHQDLARGMDAMNADMAAAMGADDIDVAFVCSMIPHHQGAIDMAKAELTHGDDPWARAVAEKVIAAQEQEIADMLAWLAEQN